MNSLITSNPYSKKDCKFKHHDFQILKAHCSEKHQVDFKYPFVCKDCNMHFILEEALFHHQKTEHEIKIDTFICNECNIEFFSISAKAYHDNLHQHKVVSELFNCKFCSHSTISSKDLFNHHQENHRLTSWQIFQCDSCNYYTKEKQEILVHMKNQHNIGGFQLEFVSRSWVINHMTCYEFECSHGRIFFLNPLQDLGGFQLLDLIITELKSRMIC